MKLCGFDAGNRERIFLIAGTCVVESESMALDTAGTLKEICAGLGIPFIYKSSFDKANRSSAGSFRGPGMEEGLRILAEVKRQLDLPILTDVHEDTPMDEVAEVADVLQTEYQERPVSFSLGNAERCRQGEIHGQRRDHGLRTWFLVRLQQSGVGYARSGRDARHRLPGCF